MNLDPEAFVLLWGIKYGSKDNVRQKVLCSKEI